MGNKSIFGIFCICVFAAIPVAAQMSYVKGYAKGAERKVLFIKTYDDFISYKEKRLACVQIDSSGNFEVSVPTKETIYAWFEIEYYTGEVYLDPGTHHNFILNGLVFNEKTDHINYQLEPLNIDIIPDSTDVLNLSIRKINVICNRFLLAHLEELVSRGLKKEIDTLKTKCDSLFKNVKHTYLKNYIKYRFASLYLMNSQSCSDNLFYEYLFHQPVLYDNIEYMSFFKQFYENYFGVVNKPVRMDAIRYIVNIQSSFPAILDSMGADTMLKNEVLREAVLLETMKNIYAIQGFNRTNILDILHQIFNLSKFEKHRKIAANLIEVLTMYSKGSPAPEMLLLNADEDTVSLDDFKGKLVYINFFTTWNVACLEELELMRKLYTKYNQSVQFISVCCDREFMKMFYFSHEKNFPWPLLHFNNDYELLGNFGVKTFPYFILLDRKGCYISNPAESPSQNIENKLNLILQE